MYEAAIITAGIICLYVAYLLINQFRKQRTETPAQQPSDMTGPGPRANITRVLPVGMLIAKSGAHRGMVFAIEPSGLKIGRDGNKNQIVIDDEVVSREHAWVGLDNGRVIIRDMHSSNGTYINSLDSPRITSETLKDGDVIYIGKSGVDSFKYRAG
jgi:pSer/pThr/pTyr-binding forkhead associated (FHA) protein